MKGKNLTIGSVKGGKTRKTKILGKKAKFTRLSQFYVITFGTTGDGMLPISCQEQVVPIP
jgi:hypothetical protein